MQYSLHTCSLFSWDIYKMLATATCDVNKWNSFDITRTLEDSRLQPKHVVRGRNDSSCILDGNYIVYQAHNALFNVIKVLRYLIGYQYDTLLRTYIQ
jgi:hypothetical protein